MARVAGASQARHLAAARDALLADLQHVSAVTPVTVRHRAVFLPWLHAVLAGRAAVGIW